MKNMEECKGTKIILVNFKGRVAKSVQNNSGGTRIYDEEKRNDNREKFIQDVKTMVEKSIINRFFEMFNCQ